MRGGRKHDRRFDGALPSNATHLVVSIGGNDALLNSDLLNTPVRSTAEALTLFGERATKFEADYAKAIDAVLVLGRETLVCTIYNGNLEQPEAPLARVALMLFNRVPASRTRYNSLKTHTQA